MLCFILTYIISTSTGLARGMRYLSESNGYITLGLLFAVLILGATPFTYVINMLMQVAGEFLFRLPQNLLWTDAGNFEPREWSGSWFIFYILWNISYVPFTGGFIARISRGRTMREFVCGTVLVPLFMTLLWFSVWGSNSCYEQLKGFLPLWETVQGSPGTGPLHPARLIPVWLGAMLHRLYLLLPVRHHYRRRRFPLHCPTDDQRH